MSLVKKIVTLFLILGSSFSLGSFFVLKLTVFPAFQDFENDAMEASMMRVVQALQGDFNRLRVENLKYSRSEALNRFVTADDSAGTVPAITQEELRSADADLFILFGQDGNRLYEVSSALFVSKLRTLGTHALNELLSRPVLTQRNDASDSLAGFLGTPAGVLQITSYPVVRRSEPEMPAGSLLLARLLSPDRMQELGERASASVSLRLSDEPVPLDASDQNHKRGSSFSLLDRVEKPIYGHHELLDVQGNTVAHIDVRSSRRIALAGAEVTRTVTLLMIALTVVFLVTSSLFIKDLIVVPLRTLTGKMLAMRESGDLDFEVDPNATDEIGVLAQEFAAMTRELSEGKRKLEQARDEALAVSSAKSDFIAKMSHEIRTPMNGVLGMTELLKSTSLSVKQEKYAQTIYRSAQSLLDVINNILDFSKIEAGKLVLGQADVHLNQLVEEVVETHAALAHAQHTELMMLLPREVNVRVKADELRLKQVLNNLISNAIKFTREGEVVIRLSAFEPRRGRQRVFFEISDTGIGIDNEQLGSIFETFTQAEASTARLYGGSGLGLAICRQLIGQMGGELEVVSSPGNGSIFSFTLDLALSESVAQKQDGRVSVLAGSRVLIVDDHQTHRDILEHQFSAWKVNVSTAESSEDAYARLVSAMAHGKPYELALIDLDMPDTDGEELIEKIRANPRFELLKIIAMSSLAHPAPDELFERFDVAGELSKPIRQSQLRYSAAAVMKHHSLVRPGAVAPDSELHRLRGKVLVVEDNEVNREVATSMLETMGLSTVSVENGLQAIEAATAEQFDLILMDCQLPVVDGWEATETIRLQEQETGETRVPIIAATANAFKADHEQCLNAGMDDCLAKPFSREQLFNCVSIYLTNGADTASGSRDREVSGAEREAGSVTADDVIDERVLSRLMQLQQPGAPNIVRKLLSLYLQSSSVIKERLGRAIEHADRAVVRESAHALKSSSMNVGALELAKLCKRLESVGRSGEFDNTAALRATLDTEYNRVVSAVKSELSGTAS